MATREENLKKINDELEKLDDEQLEQVAGGILIFRPPGRYSNDLADANAQENQDQNPVQAKFDPW